MSLQINPPFAGVRTKKKKKKSHYKDKAHAKECHDYKLHICSQEKDGHYKDLSVAKWKILNVIITNFHWLG